MKTFVSNNYYNEGTKALLAGNIDKAISKFKKDPDKTKELYLNMGNAYRKKGDFTRALECYTNATRVDVLDFHGRGGLHAPALSNIGLLKYADGDNDLAIKCYHAALQIDPLTSDAIWNCSSALLREYCSGGALNKDAWKMYDYRFKCLSPLKTNISLWDGSYVKGTLIVLAEQGLGDKIMMSRYFPMLRELCDKLVLQLPKTLWPLFSGYECTEEVYGDVGVPIGSLAGMLGMIGGGKYLDILLPKYLEPGINVAVEWAGSATHANNLYRSCYAGYFAALAKKFPKVNFWNLRPDSEPVRGIKKYSSSDFLDTARMLKSMSLLISVDTSIVHLGGALGVETWMLQPLRETDFRWGLASSKIKNNMDVESNVWYDSVAVIDNNGWEKTFATIEERLGRWLEIQQFIPGFNTISDPKLKQLVKEELHYPVYDEKHSRRINIKSVRDEEQGRQYKINNLLNPIVPQGDAILISPEGTALC